MSFVKTTDIFISYNHNDLEIASLLAKVLYEYGYSVHLDLRRLDHNEIKKTVGSARCCIVIWSENSVKSEWVRTEASHADSLGILLNISYQNVPPPFPFNTIHSLDLQDWSGDINDGVLRQLFFLIDYVIHPEHVRNMQAHTTEIMLPDSADSPTSLPKPSRSFYLKILGDVLTDLSKKITPAPKPVNFSVYSFGPIKLNSYFIVDVWAHLSKQENFVRDSAKSIGEAKKVAFTSGHFISKGTQLNISLKIPGFEIREPHSTLTWNNQPTNATFSALAPSTITSRHYPGSVTIACSGIVIAKLNFLVKVQELSTPEEGNISYVESFYPKKAFASYASENRNDVMARLQGIKKVAPEMEIFLDVLSLRSGQIWKNELEKHIDKLDIFYLFWSKYASKSKWVEIEWKMVLRKRGLSAISPIPIDEPSEAPPPEELNELHFNDAYLAYTQTTK